MYTEGEGKESDVDDNNSPIVVGHNIYILAYKLADHKRELKDALENRRQRNRDTRPSSTTPKTQR